MFEDGFDKKLLNDYFWFIIIKFYKFSSLHIIEMFFDNKGFIDSFNVCDYMSIDNSKRVYKNNIEVPRCFGLLLLFMFLFMLLLLLLLLLLILLFFCINPLIILMIIDIIYTFSFYYCY